MVTNSELLHENYPQLQNLIKRDPGSYEEEFRQQYEHFQSTWSLMCTGQAQGPHLEAMLMFMAHCSPNYRTMTAQFGEQLVSVLEDVDRVGQFDGGLRKAIVQALLLLKRDKMVDSVRVIPVLFKLLRVKDKTLRELLTTSIVQDLNKATPQLSKHVLTFLEETVLAVDGNEDEATASAAVQSLDILITVYAKNQKSPDTVRAVNIIANAGLLGDKHVKLMLLALRFLIGQVERVGGGGDDNDDGTDSENDTKRVDQETVRQAYVKMRIAGKTKGRQNKINRLIKKSKSSESGEQKTKKRQNTTFPAIQLLYDPQRYGERLLSNLKRSTAPFEAKLTMMSAMSLIISQHQLVLPDFYPVLLRYLQPHQRQVTKVLCFCAQASHPAVPGDILSVTVKAIANNFVADHCASPVIAAGLNAIRECCVRCPEAMDETLLRDLAQYKGYKDKSVMMAARSLISLYRKVSPELLHKKDRGRPERAQGGNNGDVDGGEGSDSDSDGAESESMITKSQHQVLSTKELARLQQDLDSTTTATPSTLVSPDSLLAYSKRPKMSKAQRLEHVKQGRGDDGVKRKFGAASKTAEHRASGKSQSNKVKRRGKLVSMLKRSKKGLYGGKRETKVKKRRHA
jgi:protein SDA1